MMTAEDADTLGDVFEIVQRMRLRHQLEQLEAGETPSDTIRRHDMSTIDAGVLNDAIREILAVQRPMANLRRGTSRTRTHRSRLDRRGTHEGLYRAIRHRGRASGDDGFLT